MPLASRTILLYKEATLQSENLKMKNYLIPDSLVKAFKKIRNEGQIRIIFSN